MHYNLKTERVLPSYWGWEVYVLITDHGHYVGQTGDLDRRLLAHERGEVASTKGGRPSLVWVSNTSRNDRMIENWEAKLKRAQCAGWGYFEKTTGFPPVPYRCSRCL